jgi:hypothetical protein
MFDFVQFHIQIIFNNLFNNRYFVHSIYFKTKLNILE